MSTKHTSSFSTAWHCYFIFFSLGSYLLFFFLFFLLLLFSGSSIFCAFSSCSSTSFSSSLFHSHQHETSSFSSSTSSLFLPASQCQDITRVLGYIKIFTSETLLKFIYLQQSAQHVLFTFYLWDKTEHTIYDMVWRQEFGFMNLAG